MFRGLGNYDILACCFGNYESVLDMQVFLVDNTGLNSTKTRPNDHTIVLYCGGSFSFECGYCAHSCSIYILKSCISTQKLSFLFILFFIEFSLSFSKISVRHIYKFVRLLYRALQKMSKRLTTSLTQIMCKKINHLILQLICQQRLNPMKI